MKSQSSVRFGGAVAFLLLSSAVVYADTPHRFTPGEKLTAATLNQSFEALEARLTKLEKGGGGGNPHGVVWKDRLGNVVPVTGLQFASAPIAVADAMGRWWPMNLATAEVLNVPVSSAYYTTPDCSGPVHVIALTPRVPFTIAGDANTYYVTPDNPPIVTVVVASYRGSACFAFSPPVTQDLVRLSDVTPSIPIVRPAPGTLFAAPAHPEFVR